MSTWLCCKCDIGVLDPDKKVRSASGLEFGVVCSECGQWNPTISFGSAEPIEPGVKATNPSYLKFGEDMVWACEKCEFTPLPTFGWFDFIGHCPECGHDNSHQQELKLVPGGIPADTKITIGIGPQQFNYIFVQDGKEVGKIWWDEEMHRLRFQGQVDKSVWILMKELQCRFDAWYEEKYGSQG